MVSLSQVEASPHFVMENFRFVLFGPTTTEPARLEYWDNERKWRAKTPPKRSIVLQKCFNINRKLDTRSG